MSTFQDSVVLYAQLNVQHHISDLSNEVMYDILPQGKIDLTEVSSFKNFQKVCFYEAKWKLECLNFQVLVVLKPLEVKRRTAPHASLRESF